MFLFILIINKRKSIWSTWGKGGENKCIWLLVTIIENNTWIMAIILKKILEGNTKGTVYEICDREEQSFNQF